MVSLGYGEWAASMLGSEDGESVLSTASLEYGRVLSVMDRWVLRLGGMASLGALASEPRVWRVLGMVGKPLSMPGLASVLSESWI